MSDQLAEFAGKLARTAGWRETAPDAEGRYHYFLDGGIDLDISSPDGRICILSADLGAVPDKSEGGSGEMMRRVAALAAASVRERRSTVCLSEGRLELFRRLPLSRMNPEGFVREARDFLNDEAWWKEMLSGEPVPSPTQGMFAIDPSRWFEMNGQFGG